MKILHTSDWHLGKRLNNIPRFDEQKAVMNEICEIADTENVHAVVIAGDIFDTFNPPTEATELFYQTAKRLSNNGSRAVIAIAGNHDSPDRIVAPEVLARECGIILAGYPKDIIKPFSLETGLQVINSDKGFCEIHIPGCTVPLRVILTPYANEFRMRTMLETTNEEEEFRALLADHWANIADKYCDDKGINILVTHLFMIPQGAVMPEEPEDEKPILHVGGAQAVFTGNVPKQIHYTALGHLHRPHNMSSKGIDARYAGSPLAYSFSEEQQEKSVTIVSFNENNEAIINVSPLKNGKELIRLKYNSVEEALTELPQHAEKLVELTISSDTYLTANERKALDEIHPGIVALIPDISIKDIEDAQKKEIDITKSMGELFEAFFESKKGVKPNEEIMNLFNEITAAE